MVRVKIYDYTAISRPLGCTWRRPPGRPRNKLLDQLRDDSTRPTGYPWRRAIDRLDRTRE